MSLYNEQTVVETKTITTYDRSDQVILSNPFRGAQSIEFREESIKTVTDGDGVTVDTSLGHIGILGEALTAENASETVQLRDPTTGDLLGTTATYADLYVLVFSMYYHLAEKRDA